MIKVTKEPTELVVQDEQRSVVTPMDMLQKAVQSGASMEMMEKLLDLQERWERGQARKAFDAAMASAKAKIPVIGKTKTVAFESRDQSKKATSYNHETFAGIAEVINPILAEFGLSYRFRTQQDDKISVTCIISHRDGHSEETTLSSLADPSGGKNAIQAIGSAVSYLQRYSLKAALGLAASDDDDGKASEFEPITQEQCDELIQIAEEVGADKIAFCRWAKVDGFGSIAAKNFDKAKKALQAKRGAK